jgi:SAM-dependent methyltransferase
MTENKIPFPPLEMRMLVGPTDTSFFDNPTGNYIFKNIPGENYATVFDFGCGCGRIARQLLQQKERPSHYVGIDIHKGMISWCQENLASIAPEFEFIHHDVFNRGLNPGQNKPLTHSFPVKDHEFTLVLAWSVFTHLLESQVEFYLREAARILHPSGILLTTWFLFDKKYFPMMQDFQNALFINDIDPTNATIYDFNWLRNTIKQAGLKIVYIVPPEIRGYQWLLHIVPLSNLLPEVDFPDDIAPFGIARPPVPK